MFSHGVTHPIRRSCAGIPLLLLSPFLLSVCSSVFVGPRSPQIFISSASAAPIMLAQYGRQGDGFFPVRQSFSDGKGGRPFRKWIQQLANRPVQRVSVVCRLQSGGSGFINLRFGENGNTFEGGKREYVRGGGLSTYSFDVAGETPEGRPLVLNAYDGEVYVESVEVIYADRGGYDSRPPYDPRDRDEYRNDDRYDDRHHDRYNDGRYNDDRYNDGRYNDGRNDSGGGSEACRSARVRPPRIEVGRVKPSGGLFSGKYKIEGSVFGACIEEAGYFEQGKLKEPIQFPLTDRFDRQEFSFTVRSGRGGEIRAYTSDGREEVVPVDELISNQGGLR